MFAQEKLMVMGIILSAQGLKGNIIVKSFTYPALNIMNMRLVNQQRQTIILKLIKQNSKSNLICKFNEINNRTDAEKLKGLKIFSCRSDLPLLEPNEFYIEDLRGLTVVDHTLLPLGKVVNTLNFGAGDIIEIEFLNNKIECFPFTKVFFPTITSQYISLNLSPLLQISDTHKK